MIISNLSHMKRGWFIGNFEPSFLKTSDFEIGIIEHEKGSNWPDHKHLIVKEYNVLISGQMKIGEIMIVPGDVFIYEPGEISKSEFISDCVIVCVKVPSVPDDKVVVDETSQS